MKKYFLSRLNPFQKFSLSKYPLAENIKGENIGPISDYEEAMAKQKKLNEQVKKTT